MFFLYYVREAKVEVKVKIGQEKIQRARQYCYDYAIKNEAYQKAINFLMESIVSGNRAEKIAALKVFEKFCSVFRSTTYAYWAIFTLSFSGYFNGGKECEYSACEGVAGLLKDYNHFLQPISVGARSLVDANWPKRYMGNTNEYLSFLYNCLSRKIITLKDYNGIIEFLESKIAQEEIKDDCDLNYAKFKACVWGKNLNELDKWTAEDLYSIFKNSANFYNFLNIVNIMDKEC
jgi:hypothetical protein